MAERELSDYELMFVDREAKDVESWYSGQPIEYIQDGTLHGIGFALSHSGVAWLAWYEDVDESDPGIPYPKETQEMLINLCKARFPWLGK